MNLNKLFILAVLLVISCQLKEQNTNKSINGVWESIGSGWVLEIKDSASYSLYDITSLSCLPNRQASFSEIEESLNLVDDTLSFLKGVITYKFTRIDQLPKLCSNKTSEDQKKDPLYNFEVFAETIAEHYAFMELNNIDWDSLYQQGKTKLYENSSDVGLYLVLEEMLEKLNDNHAYLEADEKLYKTLGEIDQKEAEEIGEEPLVEYGDFQIASLVAKHHLDKEMTKDSWLIHWGELEEGIGFIQVKAMWLYADLKLSDSLIEEIGFVDAYVQTFNEMYEGDYVEKEVEGVKQIMNQVMTDL